MDGNNYVDHTGANCRKGGIIERDVIAVKEDVAEQKERIERHDGRWRDQEKWNTQMEMGGMGNEDMADEIATAVADKMGEKNGSAVTVSWKQLTVVLAMLALFSLMGPESFAALIKAIVK